MNSSVFNVFIDFSSQTGTYEAKDRVCDGNIALEGVKPNFLQIHGKPEQNSEFQSRQRD